MKKKSSSNITKKKQLLLEMANSGNHERQFQVAMNYLHGKDGFEVDGALSFKWLEKSSDNGGYKADMSLAYMYRNELKDFDKAEFYYIRAEKQGVLRATQLRSEMNNVR